MKSTHHRVHILALALGAVCLSTHVTLGQSPTAPVPVGIDGRGVRMADKNDFKDSGFDKLKGAAVRGADGKQFGRLRDLILEPRTGAVRFAVVSGGGFMGGGDAKVLPFEALMRDPKDHGFLTRLQHVDWELLPELDKADIKEGRVALSTEQRRRVGQLREQNWAQALDTLAEGGADRSQRYIFASSLAGQALHGDNEKVGKVHDVIVDPRGGPALALVDIDKDYIGADHYYLVPIDSLQVPAGAAGRVHTTLAAAEFRRAAGIAPDSVDNRDEIPWARRGRHADRDRRAQDRVNREMTTPAPTGRTDGFSTSLQPNAETLQSTARAIRQAWDNDADLRSYRLRANAIDGRLVLEGAVPNAKISARARDVAERVSSRIPIENRIEIDERLR